MKTEPKITIEVIDNKWVVNRSLYYIRGGGYIRAKKIEEETKIFSLYHQLEAYLKDNLTH